MKVSGHNIRQVLCQIFYTTHAGMKLDRKVQRLSKVKVKTKVTVSLMETEMKSQRTQSGDLTVTLCCPVRLGHSHSSWLSDSVRAQGVSPISTV